MMYFPMLSRRRAPFPSGVVQCVITIRPDQCYKHALRIFAMCVELVQHGMANVFVILFPS